MSEHGELVWTFVVPCNDLYVSLYKQHFHKQQQDEVAKQLSKS